MTVRAEKPKEACTKLCEKMSKEMKKENKKSFYRGVKATSVLKPFSASP